MSISTYTELKNKVNDWLNRDDLGITAEDFILLSEAKFNRELRLVEMISRVTANADTQYMALPPLFLQAYNLQINGNPPTSLKYTQPDLMDEKRAKLRNTLGKPEFYTLTGEQFELLKTPDVPYEIEVAYYKRITPLSDSVSSNFLLADHPDLYLYGALVESAPYLKDDARIQVWGSMFLKVMEDVMTADKRKRSGGSTIKQKTRVFG